MRAAAAAPELLDVHGETGLQRIEKEGATGMTPAEIQELLLLRAGKHPEGRLLLTTDEIVEFEKELKLLELLGVFYQDGGTWRLTRFRETGPHTT